MNIEMKLNWKNHGEFNQRISLNSSLTRTKSPFLLKIPTSFLLSTVMHGLGFSSTYKTITWPGFPFEPPLRFQKDILRVVGVFDGINDAPLGRSPCALFPDSPPLPKNLVTNLQLGFAVHGPHFEKSFHSSSITEHLKEKKRTHWGRLFMLDFCQCTFSYADPDILTSTVFHIY